MKAHIRKTPTKDTYLDNLSKAMERLMMDNPDMPTDIFDNLNTKLASDEYFEKMKRDLGGEE